MFEDIGSDTKQLYIMQYNTIVNHLRSGDLSLWDSTNGFGVSVFQYTLFNPLLWILYLSGLIFGNSVMAYMLVWIMILAFILSGIAMWHFLSCFAFNTRAKFLAAYIYSFNGFITLWGQHYAFLAIFTYMPLILMLMEKAIRKKSFSPALGLVSGLVVLCTYYFSYMFLNIAAVYAVIRIWTLRPNGIKEYFSVLFKQAAAVLMGVGIGCLNLLPNMAIVFNVSARTDSTLSLFGRIIESCTLWPKEYYKTLIYRFLSCGLQGNSSAQTYTGYYNYYEAPSVFFTSLFIILLVQFLIFLIIKKWDQRLKAAGIVAVLAGAFMLLIPVGSLPFNFFVYAFSRHTFVMMPFFALMTAFMLNKLITERFLSKAGLILAAAACVFVYYKAYREALKLNVVVLAAALCVFTLLLAVFILIYANGSQKYLNAVFVLIVLVIMGQCGVELIATVRGREIVEGDSSYFDIYSEDYQALSAWLEENDDDAYRIESDFYTASYCMDNLTTGYDGVSCYNATMNSHILDFVSYLFPEMNYVDAKHILFTQVSDKLQLHDLFGIKYIVSMSSSAPYEGYELAAQFGDLYLFENTSWTGYASFYTDISTQSEYEKLCEEDALIDTAALLSSVLILEDEYADTNTLTADDLSIYQKELTEEYCIDDSAIVGDVEVNKDGSYSCNTLGTLYFPLNKEIASEDETISLSLTFDFVQGYNVYVSTSEGGSEYVATVPEEGSISININLPAGTTGIYIRVKNMEPLRISGFEFYSSVNSSYTQTAVIEMTDTGSDGSYIANVSVNDSGYFLMPIAYEVGWSVTVDGENAEALVADYGFSAVYLEAGEHVIEYSYEQPYAKTSLVITLIFTGMWIAAVIYKKKQYIDA